MDDVNFDNEEAGEGDDTYFGFLLLGYFNSSHGEVTLIPTNIQQLAYFSILSSSNKDRDEVLTDQRSLFR